MRVKDMKLVNDGKRQHVLIDNTAWLTLPSGVFVKVRDEGDDVVITIKTILDEYELCCDRKAVASSAVAAPITEGKPMPKAGVG